MKKINRIKTNNSRTIKKSFPRFLSLIIMSMLGVLVYTGLQATSPDMLHTLDNYYDKENVYDLKIISSMGLIEDDINILKNTNNIKDVEGLYSEDILLSVEEKDYVINISSLPQKINKVELLKGKLPTKENEIVIEQNFLKNTNYKIGDTITITSENINPKELTIVGTILSPLYFNNTAVSQTRGASTKGTGNINYYSYILPSSFNQDYYTSIYITVDNAKKEITSKKEYKSIIEKTTNILDTIKTNQEDNRYKKLYQEALSKIEEKEQEINEELNDSKKQLDKARKELNDAKKLLDNTKKQLNSFSSSLDNAKKQISKGKKEYQNTLKKYNIEESSITKNINLLKTNITELEQIISTLNNQTEEYKIYSIKLQELKAQLSNLEQLKKPKDNLAKAENEYNKNYSLYKTSLKKYNDGLKEYQSGLKEYQKGLKEYEDGKQTAKEEITKAKNELNEIEHPTWYIYDRSDDQTYASYINQTVSIKNLSAIFPLVFYGVAILVSLISMNRMVEDDRGEIGTLKSLGFNNKEIITKYLRFSFLATIIGALLGTIIGLTAIPYLIFIIYQLLFILPNFHFGLNLSISLTSIIISLICICGATIITAYKVLKDKPAILMRPKPPTSGKKILLEKIKPLWHIIKFSNKITIRNIFRYKKRVFVTVFGITGCTALMLCGFGIKDSIVDLTKMQYGQTFKYDGITYTNNLTNKDIFNTEEINSYIEAEQITGILNESNITMLIVPSKDSLTKIVNTINKDNKKVSLKENEVLITDKLADIHNIKKGDTITILDGDKKIYKLKVSEIVKNYMGHYIYLDKNTLSKYKEYKPNIVYFNTTTKLNKKDQEKLSNKLLQNDEVMTVIHTETLMESTRDMLKSLDKIIAVLIILAAALSFVVLYNLSNINITERKREIATLKVLGFFDNEVDNYITKENLILTIIGIIFGLIFGHFLTYIVIGTVELENTRFLREISILSCIYSSLISLVFTFIVNFVTHHSLKKINMIESLKSVE